jgi:hypothetical protein
MAATLSTEQLLFVRTTELKYKSRFIKPAHRVGVNILVVQIL